MIYIVGVIFILDLICTILFAYFYYRFEDYLLKDRSRYWCFTWPFILLMMTTIFAFCATFALLGG